MIEKLEEINHRFEEVGQLLGQQGVVADMKKFTQLSKEYRELEKVVIKYKAYRGVLDGLEHAREVLETEKDAELRELAKMELDELTPKRDALDEEIRTAAQKQANGLQTDIALSDARSIVARNQISSTLTPSA